jgi:hypothetical protein
VRFPGLHGGSFEEFSRKYGAKLLAEKAGARIRRVSHTDGAVVDPLKLCGGHTAKGDHCFAPEHLEKFFQDQDPVPQFGGAWLPVSQRPSPGIKRMPRERIPQYKLIATQPEPQQGVPYQARGRLGKAAWALLRFTRAPRCNA